MPINRKTSILWDVVGAHLSLQLCPNGSEAADDPRVERDAIHWIKPISVPRDEGHCTFGSTYRNRKDETPGNHCFMQTKLDASSMLPVPLYLATRG